jgi:hypothetical protein
MFAVTLTAPAALAAPSAPNYSDAPFAQAELIGPLNAHADMNFGRAIAVSGNTLVVGAAFEKGTVTSTLASPNTLCTWCGAAYVYERQGGRWVLTDYLKAYNAEKFDQFGAGVAIEGNTLLVGAVGEDSLPGASYTQTLVSDHPGGSIGAVYVYTRSSGGAWNFAQLVKPTGAIDSSDFGSRLAIDGDTFVAGAAGDDYQKGSAYVFTRSGGVWTQEARLQASNVAIASAFGANLALEGDTLAVGAGMEDGSFTSTVGSPNALAQDAGAVYIFTRSGTNWTQQKYLKAFNAARGDSFGDAIALHNGTLVVGAASEDGSITSTAGSPNAVGDDNGAVYVYTGSGASWTLQAYLKTFHSVEESQFGTDVFIYSDTLVISDRDNGSITSTQAAPNDLAYNSGAAYVYQRSGSAWSLQQYIKASRPDEYDYFGTSALLQDNWLFIGADSDADMNAWCDSKDVESGSVYFYQLGLPAATLSGLSLAGALSVTNEVGSTPWFQNYYGCYDALLPAAPNAVTVGYTTTAVGAAVQVVVSSTTNPTFQACPAGVCPVDVGDNVIKVSVTATDTVNLREYVIRALRPTPSSDAALSGLSLDPLGVLNPAFVSTTTSYTAAVPSSADVVTVTATTNDVAAVAAYAAAPGACTANVCALNVGVNTITVTVTAGDGTTKEYVIEITREAPAISNDASLANLTVSPATLNPAFVSSTTHYTAVVPNAVDVVTPSAALNDADAMVTYVAAPGVCASPARRGATPPAGVPCTLEVGANTITATVTAEDGTTKRDYVVDIMREAGALSIGNVWPKTGEPAGGMPVAIFGAGFTGALNVTVDGVSASFTVVNDGRIDLVMPPGVDGAYADFAVTTPQGSAQANDAFQYVAPLVAVFDGEQGAVFTTTDGVVVNVPPQGVSGSFIITLTPVPPQSGLPGDVLMHSFRLDALLNGVPIAVLSQPVTIQLPVDVSIVPSGERPWLYTWTADGGLPSAVQTTDDDRSSVSGRWALVPGQSYDAVAQEVTVALKPMNLYALSTVLIRDYWFSLVPVLQ